MTDSKITTRSNQQGISLLEILLALAILMVIGVYLSRMLHFVDAGDKADRCLVRMNDIASQMKNFYRGQETLPDPADDPEYSVPVRQLNLSQKHRLDTWGQYFEYHRAIKPDAYSGQPITDIVGYRVDGRKAAGVLISLGPDQKKNYEGIPEDNPQEFTTLGDDLLLPITVEKEAWEIVMAELEVLDKRVSAYDRLFAGIDNGGGPYYCEFSPPEDPPFPWSPYPNPYETYDLMDEDGCVPAEEGGGVSVTSLPSPPATDLYNDPNCGRATINSVTNALNDILQLYGLGDRYRTDPWGNLYQWGNSATFGPDNNRYHVFYSMGPDGQPGTDDDITPY